jgi:hypothetical protein
MPAKTNEKIESEVRSQGLLKAMVAVAFQLSMLESDIELLRERLDRGHSIESVRVNLMAAMLSAAVLQERLVQMQIAAAGEDA